MKKVLYLSNIEVPYRVRMFNELAKHCDLTVLYERRKSTNRDSKWVQSEEQKYQTIYLDGVSAGNEGAFSFRILKHVFADYDEIIVGCYNSKVQMLAILALRLMKKRYLLNLDGEVFLDKRSLKTLAKKFFLKGATGYLAAGEKAAESIVCVAGKRPITVYYFSSLYANEIAEHGKFQAERQNIRLVVGQYYDYKGMDVALAAARMDPLRQYLFVGMGKRTKAFISEQKTDELENVKVIPFLQKNQLEQLYKECSMLVLPSRQECWGLVINEAASFGTPIVSTWGSGAAVEFLAEEYPQFLAEPGNANSLFETINRLENFKQLQSYSQFLCKKSEKYSIEAGVNAHLQALGIRGRNSESAIGDHSGTDLQ